MRQSVYLRLAGYEGLNDAVRVFPDPTFRLLGSKKNWDRGAALTSRLQSFGNPHAGERRKPDRIDGGDPRADRPSRGGQGFRAYRARHGLDREPGARLTGRQRLQWPLRVGLLPPVAAVHQHGDCLAAKLRPGNVSSAEDWAELLLPEIERQQAEGKHVTFAADAAFAKPEIYEALEWRGINYVIRVPANGYLEMEVPDLLFRSPGRSSTTPLVRYKRFRCQAASWSKPRRIVAEVELHLGGLFGRARLPGDQHGVAEPLGGALLQ